MIKTQSSVASWELADQIRRLLSKQKHLVKVQALKNKFLILQFCASCSRQPVPGKNEFGLPINLSLYNSFRQKAQLSPRNMKNKRLQAAKLSIGSNGPVDCRSDHKFSLILIS
ncbi:hypothetical protein T07_12854 [Trichinella nelsoni]|uniref:Uncharacterized protein n=1 Tax=Trichinella nelsoni TaxID=6336 RepID=A0A0V0S1R8_9BILA|nr:hypothetical protein T07_12854 [Trichinella nelsoni]